MTAANQREMSLISGGQTSFLLYGAISGICSNWHDEAKTKQRFRQIYQTGEGGRFCVLEIAYYGETEMSIWKWFQDDLPQINKNTRGMFDRLTEFAPKYIDAAKRWNETWKVIASFEQKDWATELGKLQLPVYVETVAKNAPVTSEGVLAALGEVKMTMARLKWYDQYDQVAMSNQGDRWMAWRQLSRKKGDKENKHEDILGSSPKFGRTRSFVFNDWVNQPGWIKKLDERDSERVKKIFNPELCMAGYFPAPDNKIVVYEVAYNYTEQYQMIWSFSAKDRYH
ncbi:hypothetical protein V8C34DRAFT_321530 [Trichoderma compactum]